MSSSTYRKMSPRKSVGFVTPEERDEIRMLFERKNSLQELFKSLAEMESDKMGPLYERLVKDMGVVSQEFQAWWTQKAQKYDWKRKRGGNWEINFETCEIFLK
jgi:CXXX repeat modification system protein